MTESPIFISIIQIKVHKKLVQATDSNYEIQVMA